MRRPSAPTATAARESGKTLWRLPVPWLGSTKIGRWLRFFTAGTTARSRVLREKSENVRKNLESVVAEALEAIRRSAGLISASAKKPHAGFFEAFGDSQALLLGFDRAGACDKGDLIATDDDVAGGRGDSQDTVFLLGVAAHEFVRLADRDALDDAGKGFEDAEVDGALV